MAGFGHIALQCAAVVDRQRIRGAERHGIGGHRGRKAAGRTDRAPLLPPGRQRPAGGGQPREIPVLVHHLHGGQDDCQGVCHRTRLRAQGQRPQGLFDADSLPAGRECPDDTRRTALHGEKHLDGGNDGGDRLSRTERKGRSGGQRPQGTPGEKCRRDGLCVHLEIRSPAAGSGDIREVGVGKGHHPEELRGRRGVPLQHPHRDGLAAVAAAHGTGFDRILQIPLPGTVLRLCRGGPRKTHPAIPLCGRRRGGAGHPCPVDRRTTPLFQTGAATDAVQLPDMAGAAHAAAAHLRQGGDRRERLCGRGAEDHRFGRRRAIRSATRGGPRGQPSRADLRPGIRPERERHAHAARDGAADTAHDYGRQHLRESDPAHGTAGQAILLLR